MQILLADPYKSDCQRCTEAIPCLMVPLHVELVAARCLNNTWSILLKCFNIPQDDQALKQLFARLTKTKREHPAVLLEECGATGVDRLFSQHQGAGKVQPFAGEHTAEPILLYL